MKRRYLRLVRRTLRFLRHPGWRAHPRLHAFTHGLFERRLWKPCRHTVAGGVGVGLFFSMMPLPLQSLFAAVVAMRLRVNIPFAMLCCWVTNMFTEPFVRVSQERLGGWMRSTLGMPVPSVIRDVQWTFAGMTFNLGNFVLGFLTSGIILGLFAYPCIHLLSQVIPHHLPKSHHPKSLLPARARARFRETAAN
jgi:hypothetical protein